MIGGPPKVGWVIRHLYDWGEANAEFDGRSEKVRPAVVVVAVSGVGDAIRVRVSPITHRTPDDPSRAIEIPRTTKDRLGLDEARSWIILDHTNEFSWPGPDLRPVPGRNPVTIYYGALPPGLFKAVRLALAECVRRRWTAVRRRDE